MEPGDLNCDFDSDHEESDIEEQIKLLTEIDEILF